MATPRRWAVREAADVTFYSLADGKPVVTLNTLKMTDVETTGETVYSQGGRGNAKLVGFSSNREARMTLQDAIFDNTAMAMLTGNDIVTGTKRISKFEDVVIGTDGTATLSMSLATDGEYTVFLLNGNAIQEEIADATITGKTVTAGNPGDKVRVYYETETPSDSQTITVTSDHFGGSFKVVADVLVRDELTKKDYYAQFIAYNAKIEDNFTFSFSPDGDPSVLDIPLEILKPADNTVMWEFVIYGDE
jgi:hypothetical protein